MSNPTSGDRRGLIAAAVAAVLLLVGGGVVFAALHRAGPPPQPNAAQVSAPATAASSGTRPATGSTTTSPSGTAGSTNHLDFGPLMAPSAPVSLDIASIGVHARSLIRLGLDGNGTLEAPTSFDDTGYWGDGPTPGEFGPAVIGAHVDSKAGPAPFYRLGAVRPGAMVMVGRADRSTATFVVDKVARYAKADFPTQLVYSVADRAEIRLITCGGAFDQAIGHYVDNIVVFGHLVAPA